jgi:hypothetical protein
MHRYLVKNMRNSSLRNILLNMVMFTDIKRTFDNLIMITITNPEVAVYIKDTIIASYESSVAVSSKVDGSRTFYSTHEALVSKKAHIDAPDSTLEILCEMYQTRNPRVDGSIKRMARRSVIRHNYAAIRRINLNGLNLRTQLFIRLKRSLLKLSAVVNGVEA